MISAILLAAGTSTRMEGENKLSKEINGIPLINYSIKSILSSSIDELVIVVGHEKEIIKNCIGVNKKVKIIFNSDYENGIASSIKFGLRNISNKAEAFFICLADMPMISQNIYNKLIKSRYNYNKKNIAEYTKEIIVPNHDGKKGNPVLFSKSMKKKIMNITGDNGAKKIIELYPRKVLNVPFKNNKILLDFDTQENFNFL